MRQRQLELAQTSQNVPCQVKHRQDRRRKSLSFQHRTHPLDLLASLKASADETAEELALEEDAVVHAVAVVITRSTGVVPASVVEVKVARVKD